MAITWRNNEQYEKQIEAIKERTFEKSTTKVIEYAITELIPAQDKIKALEKEIRELEMQNHAIKMVIKEFATNLDELRDIAKENNW